MKNSIIILISLCLFSCGTKTNSTNGVAQDNDSLTLSKQQDTSNVSIATADSVIEVDSVLNIISKLNEVVNLEKRYKISGGKTIMLSEYPNNNFNYFWVQVGISNEIRFETIYNFYLTPKNHFVFFYDTENDTIISLEDWRKARGW